MAESVTFERVELFHMEALISARITELHDYKIGYPHMRYVADEQLKIYVAMRDKVNLAIAAGNTARTA